MSPTLGCSIEISRDIYIYIYTYIEQEGEPKKLQEEKKRSSETEDHEKQRLATLKRLKRGDETELERNLRLEKVVTSKQLRLAVGKRKKKEEQDWRMMQLPNGSGWPWRRTKKKKQDWRRW